MGAHVPMSFACTVCGGRSWLPPTRPDSFPEPCTACDGGFISVGKLAKILVGKGRRLRVATMRQYIRRVEQDRASSTAAAHVLRAIKRRFPTALVAE